MSSLRWLPALLALGACSAAAPGVHLTVVPSSQRHALVIHNNTDRPLSLKREITVLSHGKPIEAGLLYIRATCTNPNQSIYEPPACVSIPPQDSIHVAPWNDSVGDSQCVCEECGPVPRDSYQFVIESCDGTATYRSDEFEGGR
jgi:hypothetical protein